MENQQTAVAVKEKVAIGSKIGTGVVLGLGAAFIASYVMAGFLSISRPQQAASGAQSTIIGGHWLTEQRLTTTPSISTNSQVSIPQSGGSTIHTVWNENALVGGIQYGDIVYIRSEDYGATWGEQFQLSGDGRRSYNPTSVAGTDGSVHVAWTDYSLGSGVISYRRSTDRGQNWGEILNMAQNGKARNPKIAEAPCGINKCISLVWEDDRNTLPGSPYVTTDIYYQNSQDGGSTWGEEVCLTCGPSVAYSAQYPRIAMDTEGRIHILFINFDRSNPQIYGTLWYLRSDDRGVVWSEPRMIAGIAESASIETATGGKVYIVFTRHTMPWSAYFLRSLDGGVQWSLPLLMNFGSGVQVNAIRVSAKSNSSVDVIAGDYTNLVWLRSTNNGSTWGSAARIESNASQSNLESVAGDISGRLFTTFQDYRDGNWEIYLKRFISRLHANMETVPEVFSP